VFGLFFGVHKSETLTKKTVENDPLQLLLKPIRLELKKGCQDTAVSGGLQNYLRLWLEKHAAKPKAQLKLAALAVEYSALPPQARHAELEGLLLALEGAGSPAPAAAPAPKPSAPALKPSSPVSALPGLGPKRAGAFQQLGVLSVEDLLHHFPREWQDRSRLVPIAAVKPGEHVTLSGVVRGAANFRARNRMTITEVAVQDTSGVIFAMYFNQPFRQRQFVTGSSVVLSGKAEKRGSRLQIMNAEAEVIPEGEEKLIHTGRVVPIYPLAKEISQRVVRGAVWAALPLAAQLPETLPEALRTKMGLVPLADALSQIHFPSDEGARLTARERLVFDEFFTVGLGMALRKASRKKEPGAVFKKPGELVEQFLAGLSFKLTKAQLRVWKEIQGDLGKGQPMQRLVQGDVGSGKTLVAALALANAVENGWQAAMMAPTEILADQHLTNLRKWFEPLGVEVLPLKQGQSAAGKREVLAHLQAGRPLIAVGTSALIQEGVEFGNLGLVVVDEQHRFGVLQRLTLAKKAKVRPHVLVMTATPIPRTLAMTAYGDLDVSVVDELPPGRTPVATSWFKPAEREKAYEAIRREVARGRQAYVVYALVEESAEPPKAGAERRAATQMAEHLQNDIFKDLKVALLHGRMKPEEKNAVMDAFKAGQSQLLCSTTVIEVGVDVPNATVMMIEDADRFGLAQLHQLRGRVGRGAATSHCFLIGKPMTPDGEDRLKAMVRTTDGFEIAEEDLRLRGPGEILGIRQSGLPDFKLANLVTDQKSLISAKAEAEAVIAKDPELKAPEHRELGALVARRIQRKLELGEVG
jgi:ATP-dependent DNA helicase RecG